MAVPSVWDAVVVGLGGVGSFCLRALSRQGLQQQQHGTSANTSISKKILGLEEVMIGVPRTVAHEFIVARTLNMPTMCRGLNTRYKNLKRWNNHPVCH